MTTLPRPKLELPSFITSAKKGSLKIHEIGVFQEKKFWPGVPASGRQSVYEDSEKNYTPPQPVSNFDVWTDENVQKSNAKKQELYKRASESGDSKIWELWKKEKNRLRNAMKMARIRHQLLTEPAAECMMAYYCDTCDRGFKTNHEYERHCDEHVTCNKNGCSFIGHPKVVQLHQKMQHVDGMANKIMNLKTKEDIDKWRKERKRKFPTRENIAKKNEQSLLKETRGHVLKTKEFGKMKYGKRKKCRSHHQHRNKVPPEKFTSTITPKIDQFLEQCDSDDDVEENVSVHGIKRFHGIFHKDEVDTEDGSDGHQQIATDPSNILSSDLEVPVPELGSGQPDSEYESKIELASESRIEMEAEFKSNDNSSIELASEIGSITESGTAAAIRELQSKTELRIQVPVSSSKTECKPESEIETTFDNQNEVCWTSNDNSCRTDHSQNSNLRNVLVTSAAARSSKNKMAEDLVVKDQNHNDCSTSSNMADPMAILLNAHSDSDDDAPAELPIMRTACNPTVDASEVGGALGSLMASYDISSDDDDDEVVTPSTAAASVAVKAPVQSKRVINDVNVWNPNKAWKKMRNTHSSLLQKMLAKEIRQERNIMLQCVKYIINKNFFNIGK